METFYLSIITAWQITRRPKLQCRAIAQCQEFAAVLKLIQKHGGTLFTKNDNL
jgi:hypothetical protein